MANLVSLLGTRNLRWKLLYLVRALFFAMGRRWNDFYAWMLDFQDRQLTLDYILARKPSPGKDKGLWDWARGRYYLEYMRRHGLKPTDTVFDLGCGYGRVTIPLLQYQDGGHYIGSEISQKRMALAHEWIEREKLGDKSCELVLSKDNTLPFIADNTVDVVWVLSVFNHMPDQELDTLLTALTRKMKVGGRMFCFYLATQEGGDTSVKTFRRSDEDMQGRLRKVGFTVEVMPDWDDDILPQYRTTDRRMVIATKSA